MPKNCMNKQCEQSNPQHDSQFRKAKVSGEKESFCRNCEVARESADTRSRGNFGSSNLSFMTVDEHRAKYGKST